MVGLTSPLELGPPSRVFPVAAPAATSSACSSSDPNIVTPALSRSSPMIFSFPSRHQRFSAAYRLPWPLPPLHPPAPPSTPVASNPLLANVIIWTNSLPRAASPRTFGPPISLFACAPPGPPRPYNPRVDLHRPGPSCSAPQTVHKTSARIPHAAVHAGTSASLISCSVASRCG